MRRSSFNRLDRSHVLEGTVLSLVLLLPLHARSDSTADLLRAPRCSDHVDVSLKDSKLNVEVHLGGKERKTIQVSEGETVAFVNDVRVVYRGFNPFEVSVDVAGVESDDPSYTQLKSFVENFTKLKGLVGTADAKSRALSDAAPKEKAAVVKCEQYSEFHASLEAVVKALKVPTGINAAKITNWKTAAFSPTQVAEIRATLLTFKEGLKDNIKDTDAALAALKGKVAAVQTPECAKASAYAPDLAMMYEIAASAETIQAARRSLVETLSTLAGVLEPVGRTENWASDGYVFYTHGRLDGSKQLTLTVKVTPLTVEGGTEPGVEGISVTKGKVVSASFVGRASTVFTFEGAAGVVYSSVVRPSYGTAVKDGKTVVADAGSQTVSYAAAVLGNFVCRCWGTSPIYPMLQIGISADKNSPAILIGGGVRITPVALSISFGVVALSWMRDLDKLSVGSEVTGTAAIESDLAYKRAPVKPYFAIQYSF